VIGTTSHSDDTILVAYQQDAYMDLLKSYLVP
jgi:hypothetical protein